MPGFPARSLADYRRYTKRQREVQARAIRARYYEYGPEHLSAADAARKAGTTRAAVRRYLAADPFAVWQRNDVRTTDGRRDLIVSPEAQADVRAHKYAMYLARDRGDWTYLRAFEGATIARFPAVNAARDAVKRLQEGIC